jgi:hypothetical protein
LIRKIVAVLTLTLLLALLTLLALLPLLALLAFLILSETALLHLLKELLQLLTQRLLVLAQFTEGIRIALLALLALLPLLPALSSLTLLAALLPTPLVLALAVGLVAQLLLLADHVAELIEHRQGRSTATAGRRMLWRKTDAPGEIRPPGQLRIFRRSIACVSRHTVPSSKIRIIDSG